MSGSNGGQLTNQASCRTLPIVFDFIGGLFASVSLSCVFAQIAACGELNSAVSQLAVLCRSFELGMPFIARLWNH